MKKIDPTVIKETLYVFSWTIILTALMEAVFLIIGKWDLTVLFGGLLGVFASVMNFFLLGLTVQKALSAPDENRKSLMKLSQLLRYLMLIIIAVIGAAVPCFNIIAVLVPMFFPRIGISFRPLFSKRADSGATEKGGGNKE